MKNEGKGEIAELRYYITKDIRRLSDLAGWRATRKWLMAKFIHLIF